jgi:CSLREA domain-containing protein
MKTDQTELVARPRGPWTEWLSAGLITTLLLLPATGFGKPSDSKSPLMFGAHAPNAVPPIGTIFTVNSTGDGASVCPGTQCTLRGAILAANLHAGDDGISFAIPLTEPGCDPGSGRCIINLNSALPDLSTNIAINGPGADKLTVRRNTLDEFRIFNVTTPGVVAISGLTITNGDLTSGNGGGIRNGNTGTLNVTSCTVSYNSVDAGGGGIDNSSGGTVNISNSMISGNRANFGGGMNNGTVFANSETMNITNSTINGNSTVEIGGTPTGLSNDRLGGGIYNELGSLNISGSTISSNNTPRDAGGIFNHGPMSISNSTINNNITSGNGGGILNFGTMNLSGSTISSNFAHTGGGMQTLGSGVNITNSTITGNAALGRGFFFGGGIDVSGGGNPTIKSSIIALNSSSRNPDLEGNFTSAGFNLIGIADGSNGFTNGQNNDQVGFSFSPLDPKFDGAGLRNDGGPTQTIALLPGSRAIDKGTSHGLTGDLITDQRGTGFPRTFDDPAVPNATGGDGTDVGAFELNASEPTPTPTPTPSPQPTPVVVAAGSSLVNESCPPANGMIDPGETVTVNLNLTNNGQRPSNNLVATLQPSGNVLVPSGPQTFGSIASGDTVGRDFSFTANGNCGDTITLMLQLQDGSTNLGTVNYTFTLGCNTACAGAPRISTSTTFSCSGSNVVANVTVSNSGTVQATNVVLTTAKLGGINGTPLPQSIGTLAPGASVTVPVTFSLSLQIGGTYDGGTFNSTRRISTPFCTSASLLTPNLPLLFPSTNFVAVAEASRSSGRNTRRRE